MTDRKERGDRGEEAAARYLAERGCTIEARQWRCRYGELDLVARTPPGMVCFVEVKTRSARTREAQTRSAQTAVLPRDAVGYRKRERLRNAAALWLAEHAPEAPARFDVAEVYEYPDGSLRVNYLENAFE